MALLFFIFLNIILACFLHFTFCSSLKASWNFSKQGTHIYKAKIKMNVRGVENSPAGAELLCGRGAHTCGGGLRCGWVGSIPRPAGPLCCGPLLPHTPASLTIQWPLHMISGASCPPWLWDRVSEEKIKSKVLWQRRQPQDRSIMSCSCSDSLFTQRFFFPLLQQGSILSSGYSLNKILHILPESAWVFLQVLWFPLPFQ